ncbi:phage portal protein [Roseospira goensis]|uniref:Lambda family phage portal protein n=1 Tax=Roseospira goensis TaxID=391922 RepID=A0A7W6S2U8_9PROT|nr:phage portal protein [Roseospira goensis]MBB4287868.1 lambda family phage portal protein [Roseospira goensis]
MAASFSRMVRRLFRRSLDAGGLGRRWSGAPVSGRSLTNEVIGAGRTIQARATHVVRNNAHAGAAVQALVSNIVGPGIKPSSQHPDPATRERIHEVTGRLLDRLDYDSAGGLYGCEAMGCRQMIEVGECFGQLFEDPDEPGLTRLRLIHADQVPYEFPMVGPTSRVRAGVELDDMGRVQAYHVLPRRPDDPTAPFVNAFTPVRIDARDMVHLFQAHEPGQLRGLSWLAPVLHKLHELDQLDDATLVSAKARAMIMGAITDPEGNAGGMDGTQDGGVLTAGMEPGSLLNLPPGTGVDWFDPKAFEDYDAFTKAHLRAVAAGLGIPYEVLTGDLAGVNYSSIRAGLVEFRKRLEHWQHNVMVPRFCQPVWDRVVSTAGGVGLLPGYADDPAAFHRVEWLPPRQEWVDPKKDAEAEIIAIRAGLKSRTQSIAERGYDAEKIDAEIAAEQARAARLGLTLDTSTATTTPAPEAPDDAA